MDAIISQAKRKDVWGWMESANPWVGHTAELRESGGRSLVASTQRKAPNLSQGRCGVTLVLESIRINCIHHYSWHR